MTAQQPHTGWSQGNYSVIPWRRQASALVRGRAQTKIPRVDRILTSQEAGIRFEVARDILGQLIGYAATRIDAEQTIPDQGPTWREQQQQWAARRLALTPGDPDVDRVLAEEGRCR